MTAGGRDDGARSVRIVTGEDDHGRRLDAILAARIRGESRTALAQLVRDGRVKVAGEVVTRSAARIAAGVAIEVAIPPPARCELQPEDIPLEVVHDDADIVVVNKPAGLVVHPAHGHPSGTLVNALLAGPLAPAPDDDPAKPGIVHRLDRDTSGLMVIARTAAARRNLQEQFRARTVDKTYLAVVEGSPPRVGTIDAAVGRDQRDRKRMAVRADGKPARSRYRVLERLPGASLVEVVIETGRTHQIRVHMRSLGHPLVGDKVYGHRRGGGGGPLLSFPRQALHAAGLRFRHPRTGVDMAFRAPLPEDILELLRALRGCGDEPSVV